MIETYYHTNSIYTIFYLRFLSIHHLISLYYILWRHFLFIILNACEFWSLFASFFHLPFNYQLYVASWSSAKEDIQIYFVYIQINLNQKDWWILGFIVFFVPPPSTCLIYTLCSCGCCWPTCSLSFFSTYCSTFISYASSPSGV